MGGLDHGTVERKGEFLDPHEIIRRTHLLDGLVEAGQHVGVAALGGPTRGETVDQPEELIVIADDLLVEGVDEGSPVQFGGHPTLALEGDDRFANRYPADTHRLGHCVLRQPHAFLQLSVEYQATNVGGRLFAASLPDDGTR